MILPEMIQQSNSLEIFKEIRLVLIEIRCIQVKTLLTVVSICTFLKRPKYIKIRALVPFE